MKYNYRKLFISILMIISVILCLTLNSFAHSGRTDSSGGHKDNKNKSGLGSYHYHCGGNPPHLHTNGVCPYSSNSTNKSSSSSKTITNNVSTKSKVLATNIEIKNSISIMKVGGTRYLNVDISPTNVTDSSVIWSSSNESIATISSAGLLEAKKAGIVTITATTSNNKSDSIEIKIEEEKDIESNKITNNTNQNIMNVNSTSNKNSKSSNTGSGMVAIGLLGGGTYLGYRKYKNSKK